jgi:virginiamycin B lyase
MTWSTSKCAAGLMARPLWRSACLVISLLAVAAISAGQPGIETHVYPLPHAELSPHAWNFTEGPDGAMWFTESKPCTKSPCPNHEEIGRITHNGVITEYELPSSSSPLGNGPIGIATGSDGAIWFTELRGNKIGRITTAGVLTEYPLPLPANPYGIAAGSDGALWFTEPNPGAQAIGRITTAGVVTIYPLGDADPVFIVAGRDGALWFTEGNFNRIGRISTLGQITRYPVPTGCTPEGIATGPDGALWFTCLVTSLIGRITTGGTVTTYTMPTANSQPVSIIGGPDGALWFTEQKGLGRITISGVFTEYPTGFAASAIAAGLGELWTNAPAASITQIILGDTTPPVITPHISGTLGSNGWYRSNVTLSWDVTDAESGIASSSGCGTTTLAADTPGVTLTCSATNGAGLSASKAITIKIDQTPPVISGMPGPDCSIWPPDHRMIPVATVTAADAMSGIAAGSFKVTGTSNEPPSGPQISIVQSAGAYTVALLAERSSDGTGRIYTLRAVASDQAGNTTTINATCTVPHDQRN